MIHPEDKYLGESFAFWAELKKRADTLDVRDLVRDLALMRGKIASYEALIERMNQVKDIKP